MNWARKAYERGHSLAATYLGHKYANRENLEFNLSKALFYYRAAAARGHAYAKECVTKTTRQNEATKTIKALGQAVVCKGVTRMGFCRLAPNGSSRIQTAMSLEEIKQGIASLSTKEQTEVTAFLFHLPMLPIPATSNGWTPSLTIPTAVTGSLLRSSSADLTRSKILVRPYSFA